MWAFSACLFGEVAFGVLLKLILNVERATVFALYKTLVHAFLEAVSTEVVRVLLGSELLPTACCFALLHWAGSISCLVLLVLEAGVRL